MELSDKVIKRNGDIAWRDIDGEALLVDTKAAVIYPLDEVGTSIWGALDGERSCRHIASLIEDEFEGESAGIQADVLDFIKDLVEKGLAEICV